MKLQTIELLERSDDFTILDITFSVQPFVAYLEGRINKSSGFRRKQLLYILNKIKDNPKWKEDIAIGDLDAYADILEFIYTTLSVPLTDEDDEFWALALPFTPKVLYGSDALYNFLKTENGDINENLIQSGRVSEKNALRLVDMYSLILKRFYGLELPRSEAMIHQMKDEKTGLNRYFSVDFDSRFVEISYKGRLPEINFDHFQLTEDPKQDALALIQNILPITQCTFSGFSILIMKEVTSQQAIEHIKNIIVNLSPGQPVYGAVTGLLKELLGNSFLDISLVPILKLNNKLVTSCFDELDENRKILCNTYNISTSDYHNALDAYSRAPKLIFRKNVAEPMEGEDMLFPVLRIMGVEGVIVLPIIFQKKLVGILTIYAKQKGALNENMLAALEPAIPLLEQLLQTTIDDFNVNLDNVVKEKFTSLQPSVEWRFNEVAFDYLQQKKKLVKAEIDQVYFADVYPLYGAIDIRNSTQERSIALIADMKSQLTMLINVLQQLTAERELGLTNELIFKTKTWLDKTKDFISSDEEFRLNQFFELEVTPFLLHFRQAHPNTTLFIDDYFIAIGPSGITFSNRRKLEESFQLLNRTISNLLEQMNVEIQEAYPCYFEKYRSDGIEYDIYMGQSITPDREFHPLYLRNLRLWQLNSMAIVAKLTHALQHQLAKKLETTQLIFIHAHTIDISFRNEEHRFDVEGAYNIRYEMIKKRIDKIHIKGTTERLTQPGKIALVYFQHKDTEEYLAHIHYLQNEQILTEEIEFLELDELQGVNGLKAVRVGIMMDVPE